MDPRQPQQHLPFSRNTSSPYGRTPFPPTSNQQQQQPSPYPPSSHPPNGTPSYAEHQRRPSEGPYYPQRNYPQDGAPMPGAGHSRHGSTSSIAHGTPVGRGMPPPSSPQQPPSHQPPPPPHQAPPHNYGPPQPRPPPLSVGPPSAFPSGPDRPTLPPLGRTPSTAGSSMSISSMLGGPSPATREPLSAQYTSPIGTSAPPPPMYTNAPHASPRVGPATAPDYVRYGRPQTPDRQRPPFDTRDHRANSAGSPPGGAGQYGTPDSRRFGTPQTYGQRPPQGPMGQHPEERRDSQTMRVANMPVPPRPSSQPTVYNHPITRQPERAPIHEGQFAPRADGRRPMEALTRAEPAYQRAFENSRRDPAYEYGRDRQERERQLRERENEAVAMRERELIERARSVNMNEPMRPGVNPEYPHQMAQRNAQPGYSRPPEPPREQPAWMRSGYDQPRVGYEPSPYDRPPPGHPANGYEYPRTSAPQYQGHPAYAPDHDLRDHRYPPAPHPPPQQPGPIARYEPREPRYEAGINAAAQHQQHMAIQQHNEAQKRAMQAQQPIYGGPEPNAPYQPMHESPRRAPEEAPPMQQQNSQRSFLGVQENRRGGRISPIPQPVQGAQVQPHPGPPGEPGIKLEFNKMFAGIGSGVGLSMSMPSPVPGTSAGLPFSGLSRREDLENTSTQNSPIEGGSHMIARTTSLGGRRRKIKDDDRADDESSTGRQTPTGRTKRAKPHRHHHHHRPEPLEHLPIPQALTPFRNVKGSNANVSPPNGERSVPHHHIPRHHHHHHSSGPKASTPSQTPAQAQVNTIIKLPRLEIRSQEVLEDASRYPRAHLGFEYYQPNLKPRRSLQPAPALAQCGFASTTKAIPNFEGKINCTYTIKIPRVHLSPRSREEITYRRAVWGTEVYSDDSDIIAACIHQGWFCGKWHDDVDVKLLGLNLMDEAVSIDPELDTVATGPDETLFDPPQKGPMPVYSNRDLHVDILILPPLIKYSSTTRFGIKSREWGGKNTTAHDGLSYMIKEIKWVDGVDSMEGGSRAARKKMMMRRLRADEAEREAWEERVLNGNGKRANSRAAVQKPEEESFERGGEIKGVGTNSWWKKDTKGKGSVVKKSEKGSADLSGEQQDTEMMMDAPVENPITTAINKGISEPSSEPGLNIHKFISGSASGSLTDNTAAINECVPEPSSDNQPITHKFPWGWASNSSTKTQAQKERARALIIAHEKLEQPTIETQPPTPTESGPKVDEEGRGVSEGEKLDGDGGGVGVAPVVVDVAPAVASTSAIVPDIPAPIAASASISTPAAETSAAAESSSPSTAEVKKEIPAKAEVEAEVQAEVQVEGEDKVEDEGAMEVDS